jgi:hypothetical protein
MIATTDAPEGDRRARDGMHVALLDQSRSHTSEIPDPCGSRAACPWG